MHLCLCPLPRVAHCMWATKSQPELHSFSIGLKSNAAAGDYLDRGTLFVVKLLRDRGIGLLVLYVS